MSRRSLLRMVAGGGAFVALAGSAACSGAKDDGAKDDGAKGDSAKGDSGDGDSDGANGDGGPAAAAGPGPGQKGYFGGTDLAWVEINIAMDEQLSPLLALAPVRASRPAVRAFAASVDGFTQQELTVLRGLHDQAKLPAENPHEGMQMPGMVTPETVTRAGAATGAAFDKLLLEQVKAHLEQGTSLAGSEEKAGVEPQTLALAKQVSSTRATALEQLKALSAA
jgi:uncharacterized protein (DUF305 family)